MTEILLGIALFTLIVMILVLTVLVARKLLLRSVRVTVTVNGDRALPAMTGQKLLQVLHGNAVFVPSPCGGLGTCGLCRVTVAQGGGQALPTERAKLSRAELRENTRLACQVVVRQDMQVQVSDDILDTEVWQCRVTSTRWLAPFIREIVLELPPDVTPDLRAGAFVQVAAPPHEVRFADFKIPPEYHHAWSQMPLRKLTSQSKAEVTRAYSIANRPADRGNIVLNVRLAVPPPAIKDAPPGIVSSYLFSLSPGETVKVSGPYGDFGAKDSSREMIFIGGGVGMAPLRAIIFDQLECLGTGRRISFWYGARDLSELFYVREFDHLQTQHSNFSWTVALSDPKPGDNWHGPTGFIHNVVFKNHLDGHPAPEECEYYLCGPPLMIRAVMSMLEDIGVDQSSIFNDDFGS
ncbi:MAG: NADH:ubiquinone reductase (Na(+)-transporting) subunit F [Rhodobacteraceae bacterium]|nr:NADH:ubiquinone reductase (Na(+)-transporting) subunit F [Paracoccaceae bacterium]